MYLIYSDIANYLRAFSITTLMSAISYALRAFQSHKEPADMRIEKSDGNQHSKNEMAFPELLQVFC